MAPKLDRREFLRCGVVTTAALMTTGSVGMLNPGNSYAEQFPDVVVAHLPAAFGEVGKDLVITGPDGVPFPLKWREIGVLARSAVEALGGMKRFVKPGAKVVIKPNMSFGSGPEAGSNTHPAIVREVALMCIEAGASSVAVVDNVLHSPADCLAKSQIPAYCKDVPKTSVNVVKDKRLFREVKVEKGRQLKSMEVLSAVLDADVLIAVPVGKSHSSSAVSLSMKGMMGLIHDRMAFHSRYDLHESIVDMVTVLKPQLVVIDGTRILSTGGPGGPGKVIPLNLVIASPDMVAADAQMVALGTWYGKQFKPDQVRHIKLAAERGLGSIDLQKLNVKNINV